MNKSNNEKFWIEVNDCMRVLLKHCCEALDSDTIQGVEHYLNHDEYEMAFEGLFIDLMKANYWPSDMDISCYLSIGKSLHLDEESTFNPDFWDELLEFSRR